MTEVFTTWDSIGSRLNWRGRDDSTVSDSTQVICAATRLAGNSVYLSRR